MATERQSLPSFSEAPVVETVLEVDFAPLAGWGVPHFGMFWAQVRDQYPRFEVHPALFTPALSFSEEDKLIRSIMVDLAHQPPLRVWFLEQSGTRLLQIQGDRFIHNWRKVAGTEPYPRYENIRPIFEQEWGRFCAFLQANGISAPAVKECEVTYINHIPKGKGWNTLADLGDVVRCWSGCNLAGLPSLSAAALSVRYPLPDHQGALSIQLQPAIRSTDREEILQLSVTARCRPRSAENGDLFNCLDAGREYVVNAFAEFTTPKMHAIWKREDRP